MTQPNKADETPPPTTRAGRLEQVLRAEFAPVMLAVEDESALHAGHAGARAGGETHYRITIVTEQFSSLKRIERSRLVHNVLSREFAGGLHALSLILRSPSEI